MTGLLTLPARLWLRGAKKILHTAEDVTGRALITTLRVAGTINDLRPGGGDGHGPDDGRAPEPAERPAPSRGGDRETVQAESDLVAGAPEPDPRIAERAESDAAPVRPETNGASGPLASERLAEEGATTSVDLEADDRTPAHVSEQATLVREEAEPGAEDGAGAALHVAEPWQGYERMNARDIVARLNGAAAAELGAVQLYESTHRNRQTIIAAVERELRAAANRDNQ